MSKNKAFSIFFQLVFVGIASIFFLGCDEGGGSSSSLVTDDNGNPEVGTASSDGMYIRIFDEGEYDFFASYTVINDSVAGTPVWNADANSDFSNRCQIDNDDLASGNYDITCYLDIQELDLWFHDIGLQINIPKETCSYTTINLPYWYEFESGYGPSSLSFTYTTTEDGDLDTGMACSFNDGTTNHTACNSAGAWVEMGLTIDPTPQPTCIYDHSQSDEDNPNCCFGTYDLTANVTNSDGDNTIETTTDNEWGGGVGEECYAGPATTGSLESAGTTFTAGGLPTGRIFYTFNDGFNDKLVISAAQNEDSSTSQTRLFNGWIANYWEDGQHTHDGIVSATTSELPFAMDPIDDRDGTGMAQTQPYYDIKCLDSAGEIKHRIRALVREWNTYAQFNAAITNANGEETTDAGVDTPTLYDPDVGDPDISVIDEDGTVCDYQDLSIDGCNDFYDFDDIPGKAGYSNPTTATQRQSLFPAHY